ncbi:MAG: type I restriction enzyme HsdR N-terminal domain-containing protein [Humidesulfovibrio sp.]|uniref:type I restriction enzyme HsdR N-terminal domain-containing protein n=1 Tax=Humidesulfovibrio sp. TaxID=2910988 RepID=UPI002735B707|nr:type I restriction enzyme HsdR N-terminal domain-containing protein [Humidesulfovibrio sp.]MDP2846639.1 type I restriction enzyme HsdR N-terminal domain-containing protein [Humidesulfovibrio sp.]
MHEVSLGGMLTDYLTGQTIEETTYEEFRQALAKFLVEEKGYPKRGLKAKVPLIFKIDGVDTGRHIDLVACDDAGVPMVLVIFCAGEVGSFERETVSCARLFPGGPVPVAVATDSIGASILNPVTGDCVATGVRSIPTWEQALALNAKTPRTPLTDERRRKEERILHAYNGFLYGGCCSESCRVPPKGDE